ncbi:MAG: PEP-CTERM sorting domain-containing protein [Symploca sp. SIO2D2]|nr:PEP-CTERM sorting domain-containing protein [Symploca sp. SIO2D2]
MLKHSLSVLAGSAMIGICLTEAAAALPNIELNGVTFEISFEFDTFDSSNISPDLQAVFEAQPWYTGVQTDLVPAFEAASQVYNCNGPFEGSSCSTPFDEFGSTNPLFGGTSPLFVYDLTATQINSVAVGLPNMGGNELSSLGSSGSFGLHYAVAKEVTAQTVPEPATIFGLGTILVLGLMGKVKGTI